MDEQIEMALISHGDDWRIPQHIVERNRNAAVMPPTPYHLRPKPYDWTIREDDWNV